MCGIAGAASLARAPVPDEVEARVHAMLRAMAHRGPDSSAASHVGPAVLGATRLAIVDLTPQGNQPQTVGAATVTQNGEIYNHEAIRAGLEKQGALFRSSGDTEALAHAYMSKGPRFLHELRGMFALAVWDANSRRLLVARDALGIKPLYWCVLDDHLLWASEIGALVAAGAPAQIDEEAVATYLARGHVPAPRTIYRPIRALPPGHRLTIVDGRPHVEPWPTGEAPILPDALDWGGAVAAARTALDDTVAAHLVSDVPVGLFLSAGVDSAAIAASLQRLGRSDVQAFTISWGDGDEADAAAAIAREAGLRHQKRHVGADRVLRLLPRILRAMDQPTMDGVNTYVVAEAYAGVGGRVALSGLGGDEAFGGYPHTRQLARAAPLARALRSARVARGLGALLAGAPHGSARARVRKLLALRIDDAASLYDAARRVLDDDTLRYLGVGAAISPVRRAASGPRSLREELEGLERANYLRDQLLRDTDVMTMAHSVEARVPFVDTPFLRAIAHVPRRHIVHAPPKALLRATIPATMHAQVERAKRGFTLPFATWLAGPLRAEAERGLDALANRGLVRHAAARDLLDGFDRKERPWSHVWTPMVLGLWLDEVKAAG